MMMQRHKCGKAQAAPSRHAAGLFWIFPFLSKYINKYPATRVDSSIYIDDSS